MMLPPKKSAPDLMIAVGDESGGGSEVTVPTELLELSGPAPKEGDSISFQVDGKVTGIDGGSATISIEKVNGEALGGGEEAEVAPEAPDEMAGLKEAAQAEDKANYPE